MSSIVIAGDSSGSVTLQAPAVAGSTVLNLPSTSGTIQTSGAGYTTNGVAYATSTSALATGSALTFDGTNLGVGTSSPNIFSRPSGTSVGFSSTNNAFFQVNAATGSQAEIDLGVNSVRQASIFSDASTFSLIANTNIPMVFGVNNSEQMRLTSTGLGIGTSSPSNTLTVGGSNPQIQISGSGTSTDFRINAAYGAAAVAALGTVGAHPMFFFTSNTERMRLDSAGNLGLGVTPSAWNTSNKAFQFSSSGVLFGETGNTYLGSNIFVNSAGDNRYITTNFASMYRQVDGKHLWYTAASGSAGASISFTNPMSLDASGNLMVNTTSTLDAVVSVIGRVGANAAPFSLRVGTSGDYGFTFKNDAGTLVGAIGVNSSSTSYNTSSDYRLKENIAPMTGALATVAQLKPCTYTWKVDGSSGQGFIAHELQAVVPDAVVGEKDAVDEEGNIKSQGIDTSFLVATLTAAIQEQQALINTLTDRISVLENK